MLEVNGKKTEKEERTISQDALHVNGGGADDAEGSEVLEGGTGRASAGPVHLVAWREAMVWPRPGVACGLGIWGMGCGCRSDCEDQQSGQGNEAMEEHDGILYSRSRKSYSTVTRRQRALYGIGYQPLLFFYLSSCSYDLVSEEALPSPWFKTWRYFGLRIMDLLEVLRGYCRLGSLLGSQQILAEVGFL